MRFARLAVCIVDEQHRFGVRQRAALDAKGPELADGARAAPHVLHMTATPIPRTLSLTAYGDLDATTLRELPAGRQPVKTWAVGEEKRAGAYEFVRERLREGRQAFFVCPLVEGSAKLEAKAASEEAERLAKGEMRDFRVALLHGQMHSRDKAAAMEAFASGEADVLVATSVIEVGIDVPNATVMVVEGAERYGLSQLHQLRGRVGRGEHESYCILFGDPASDTARRRLDAIASERDGFKLAEVDLSLRGEGEILGTLQSGLPRFLGRAPSRRRAAPRRRPPRGDRAPKALRVAGRPGARPPPRRRAASLRRRAGRGHEPHRPRTRSGGADAMRVVAGEFRGRRLKAPSGAAVRPTSDRAREALFSILGDIAGADVCDLFCGTGALGIEALSRGARHAVMVDDDTSPAQANVDALGISERVDLMRRDAFEYLGTAEATFDLILCDPPYTLAARVARDLEKLVPSRLREGGRLVTESPSRTPMELNLTLDDDRTYGEASLRIWSAP